MPAVSSIFLVIALVLAVVIGPQTRAWTWGPALLALGGAVAAAMPVWWRKSRSMGDVGLLALGTLVAGWFAWRASVSPVAELGQADLLLLFGTVGAFVCLRAIEGNKGAEAILIWGIALLLLANVAVVGKQVLEPEFTPVFGARPSNWPSGFFAHYNEAANYLIASSLIVAAAALFGSGNLPTRILWGLIAVAGLAAVYFTHSRGGILGAAIGSGVFACAALTVAKRSGSRWFTAGIIGVPVIGIVIVGFLISGWQSSQEIRNSNISGMMDNNSRLHLLGIAASCVSLHPMAGGGSRSFSWESFRFFENKLHGDILTHKPEQVHNELMQAATDYGLVGAGLLTLLLGAVVIVAVLRILFSHVKREPDNADVWRVGGLAALAGMFIQSCFSFVFHLIPGVLLLGICLGLLSRSSGNSDRAAPVLSSRILLSVAALACLAFVFPYGWKGTQVTRTLWSSYLSKTPVASSESKTDALTEAIEIWPQAEFYQDRATIHQETSMAGESAESTRAAEMAIADYARAEQLHRHDPGPVINRANLLSQLERDAEAEEAYDRAIQLQGGMEPSYRGHFALSNHLLRKGARGFRSDAPSPALDAIETAAQQMEVAVEKMHWVIPDMQEPRVSVHESLGAAREANGDYEGALSAFDFTTTLVGGAKAHFRAGLLYGKMAAASWAARRPAEAMGYFIEAKRRLQLTADLPLGVTPAQRLEYLAYLDETIAFLTGAKIEPIPSPN